MSSCLCELTDFLPKFLELILAFWFACPKTFGWACPKTYMFGGPKTFVWGGPKTVLPNYQAF